MRLISTREATVQIFSVGHLDDRYKPALRQARRRAQQSRLVGRKIAHAPAVLGLEAFAHEVVAPVFHVLSYVDDVLMF